MNQLKEMIKKLFALKGRSPEPYVVGAWCEVLQKFDVKAVAQACNNALQKEGYFEIKMLLDELTPNIKDIAISEWNRAVQVAKDGGHGFSKLSSDTIKALRHAGGLRKLQYSGSQYTVDKMQKDFIENYSRKEVSNSRENYFFISDDKRSIE
jgi:hypothetical protein